MKCVAFVLAAAVAGIGAGCGGAGELSGEGWPRTSVQISVDRVRSNPQLRSSIPQCREASPDVTPDSIGPWRAGQTLTELTAACPQHVFAWDWGFAGVPAPAVATRLGDAVVIAVLNDTLPAAHVSELATADLGTPEGLGAGSPLYDLLEELGPGRLVEGPCIVEIVFDARPGLSFLLAWPGDEIACDDIPDIVADNDLARLPPDTFVRHLTQFRTYTAPEPDSHSQDWNDAW
jgi:hypothetical protein